MVQLPEQIFLIGRLQAKTLRHGMIRLKTGWASRAQMVFQACQAITTSRYLKLAPKRWDIRNAIPVIWRLTVSHVTAAALVSKSVSVFRAVSPEQNGQRSIQKFQKAKLLASLKFGPIVRSCALSMIRLVRSQVLSMLIRMATSICRKHGLSV